MKRTMSIIAGLGVAAVVTAGAVYPGASSTPAATLAPAAAPENYQIDGVHSTVIYKIEHMGVAPFYGRFNEVSGTFTFDESNPAAATFSITIPTASVDSGNAQRDRHLQSGDFFNAREHPQITFKSTKAEAGVDGLLSVTGDLTLHGVTKPITATVTPIGARDGGERQGFKRGFGVEATIKRSDFGMTYGLEGDALGDEVTLLIGLEGVRK